MKKGTYTAKDAANQGRIDAGPIEALVQRWVAQRELAHPTDMAGPGEYLAPCVELAARSKTSLDLILRLNRGEKAWIEFDNADRIVCAIGGGLYGWLGHDELREIYETFDFSHLDLNRPTCEEAVEDFFELAGALKQRQLGALYGVTQSGISRAIKRREQEPVAA